MDLAKFTDMVSTQTLWCASVATLQDPFEGSIPEYLARDMNHATLKYVTTQARLADMGFGQADQEQSRTRAMEAAAQEITAKVTTANAIGRARRNDIYVNCWNRADVENEALWRLYGVSDQCVAVRSDTQRLFDAVERTEFAFDIVDVGYTHYGTERPAPHERGATFDPNNRYARYFHKRTAFSFEREVRLILDASSSSPGVTRSPQGIRVPVDLQSLLTGVVVSPYAPDYFYDAVRYVALTALTVSIERSAMLGAPVFGTTLHDHPTVPASP